MADDRQHELGFIDADIEAADRKAILMLALKNADGANLSIDTLVHRIFEESDSRGVGQVVELDKETIASYPMWLHCSVSHAKRVVRQARDMGLISVRSQARRGRVGGDDVNCYGINWVGVFSGLGFRVPAWAVSAASEEDLAFLPKDFSTTDNNDQLTDTGSSLNPMGSQLNPMGSQLNPMGSQLNPMGSELHPMGSQLNHRSVPREDNAQEDPQCSACAGALAPTRSLSLSSLSSTSTTKKESGEKLPAIELPEEIPWERAVERAERAKSVLFPAGTRDPATLELILSAAVLAETVLSDGWFETALVASRRGKQKAGYFRSCLRNCLVEYEAYCSKEQMHEAMGRLLKAVRPEVRLRLGLLAARSARTEPVPVAEVDTGDAETTRSIIAEARQQLLLARSRIDHPHDTSTIVEPKERPP